MSLFLAYLQNSQNKTVNSDQKLCSDSDEIPARENYSVLHNDQKGKSEVVSGFLQAEVGPLRQKSQALSYDWQAHRKSVKHESIDISRDKPETNTIVKKKTEMTNNNEIETKYTLQTSGKMSYDLPTQESVTRVPVKVQYSQLSVPEVIMKEWNKFLGCPSSA